MENISFSLALIMLALILSDLFALINFFNFSVWICLALVFLFVGLTFLFINWSNKLQIEKKLFFIIALIMTEFFWALTLLPISFYINGVVLGLMFFLIVNLIMKKNKEGILTNKTLGEYVLLGTIVLIFICILAKWR